MTIFVLLLVLSSPSLLEAMNTVKDSDRALANALARKDEAAFRDLLTEEAIFLGGTTPSRGPDAIVDGWSAFFEEESGATLEWEPTDAVVAGSGELAVTRGSFVYRGAEGQSSKGTYLTAWRLDDAGRWRVLADGTLRVSSGGELPDERRRSEAIESRAGDLRLEFGVVGGGETEGAYFAVYVGEGDDWLLYGASHTDLGSGDETTPSD